ncbi:HET-domain-containing protein, partial [Dichomitus squalens LYAD-421 SS1]
MKIRLLDTRTGHFVEKDPKHTEYAILSHRWNDVEQSHQGLRGIQRSYDARGRLYFSRLPVSIREACRVAREAGYRYLWIDSCCIDKTSSSELTESINSMFLWYSLAKMCYAYLADVPSNKDPRKDKSAFCSSQWHKRGWTLQELIAPSGVKFLADDWTEIGTKFTLFDLIEEITGIPRQALLHVKSLDEFSVAQRLSWAARRQTTREEDRAYSLLGIFNINMPTLYGEGSRAFRRLQEEIVRHVPDLSLFAWNRHI